MDCLALGAAATRSAANTDLGCVAILLSKSCGTLARRQASFGSDPVVAAENAQQMIAESSMFVNVPLLQEHIVQAVGKHVEHIRHRTAGRADEGLSAATEHYAKVRESCKSLSAMIEEGNGKLGDLVSCCRVDMAIWFALFSLSPDLEEPLKWLSERILETFQELLDRPIVRENTSLVEEHGRPKHSVKAMLYTLGLLAARTKACADALGAPIVLPEVAWGCDGTPMSMLRFFPRPAARHEQHGDSVTCLTALPGGFFASGSDDCSVRVWNDATMEVVHVLQGHMAWVKVLTVMTPAAKSHSQEEDDFCTVIKTDEAARTFLVSGSLDRMIRLWDIETWTTEAIFESESSVLGIVWTGEYLISVGGGGVAEYWNVATGLKENSVALGCDLARCICLRQERAEVLVGCSDGYVGQLCSGANATERGRHRCHTAEVNCIAMLTNGSVATGGTDRAVKLWGPSWACLHVLEGHNPHHGTVNCVFESTFGLLSASFDDTIKLWDLKNGSERCLATLDEHQDSVCQVIELSGLRILSCSEDSSLIVWE